MQKLKFVLLTLFVFVLTVFPAFAQEAAEAAEAPRGIDLMLLLVGAGVVMVIGGAMAAREMGGGDNDS